MKQVTTGDTICDEKKPIILESMEFPAPVIRVAVEPKTRERSGQARAWRSQAAGQEDPTFNVSTDPETGQTIIAGMGELHLEIIVDRMKREFGVEANVGKPQVAYRETHHAARAEGKEIYKKQTGGRGQYGHVEDRDRARARAKASCSRTRSPAARFRKEYIKPVEKGIKERWSAASSPAMRWTTSGCGCTTVRYHEVDSNEMAVQHRRLAGVQGCRRKGQAGAARADHASRGGDARRVHGRSQSAT